MDPKLIAKAIAEELLKEGSGEKKESSLKPPAPIKKEAEEAPKVKTKSYYDVKVESMIPATLTYRVLAEEPAQAAQMIKGMNPNNVQYKLFGRKDSKLTVFDAGSSMIRWVQNLFGGR